MRKHIGFVVFSVAVIAFVVNQFHLLSGNLQLWCSSYLDDVVYFPIVLSIAAWSHSIILNRTMKITPVMMIAAVIIVSFISEFVTPFFIETATADLSDCIAYSAGALIFYFGIYPSPDSRSERPSPALVKE